MNVSDIITEHGAVYQDKGQNMARLYQVARRTFDSEDMFTLMMTDETIWQGARVLFGRLVQAFQRGFTPINPANFQPVSIRMFHQKADSAEYPDDLEATWLGFLASDNVKRTEWPFIRWYLETQFFPQIQEDIEISEIGKGVYAAPTTGTAGAAGASMDGFLTTIAGHITAGRTTPITMGAIPATDNVLLVKYFEDFADLINKKYWNRPMVVNTTEAIVRRYQKGLLEKYGKNYVMNEQNLDIKFSNLTLKGRVSMEGSSRIFCTPKENAVLLKKKTQNQKLVDIQAFDRQVKFLTDWYLGAGFILPELVFCSDQA